MCVNNEKTKHYVWWIGRMLAETKTLTRKKWNPTGFRRIGLYMLLTVDEQEGRTKLNGMWLTMIPGLHIHITSWPAVRLALGTWGACLEGCRRDLLSCCKRWFLTCPLCVWWSQASLQPWFPQERSCLKLTHGVLKGILWDSQYIHNKNLCQKRTLQH